MRRRFGTTREGQSTLRSAGARRGVVWVTAGLAMVALMGMAALTIDLGRMTVAVQRAQAVADAAAMAAVNQMPDGDLANARLAAAVAANNEVHPWPQVAINTDQDVTYYSVGDEVPGYGLLPANQYAVTVQARVNEDYGFAKVAGLEQMNIVRPATAKIITNMDLYPSLFTGGDGTEKTGITNNGSGIFIEGDVHCNSSIKHNGGNGYYARTVVYNDELTINGSGVEIAGGAYEGPILDYPLNYTWDSFLPWTTEVSNIYINEPYSSMEIGHLYVQGSVIIDASYFHGYNGILMVEGDVIFSGEGHYLENVTIIAKGVIFFEGACQQVSPYTENLALMSLSSSNEAIVFAGSNSHNYGTFFAPYGGIIYSGSSQMHQYGSLMSRKITINGSDFSIFYTEGGGGEGATRLAQLIE